ncbi:S-adenosylmethionine synthase [Poriferisphaera corsica]|uniref:S-adenosylmethionine synthase n=1 Tax=Poriferisphaera corsica TaxID=2528020 RepID=A0A517YVA6_9BACT|nr:methionine adenosyltransferase [Poriferisphaera corsica]QDU34165.1 S-adenosylmethionine synthase [Poriferisphaera corsica]
MSKELESGHYLFTSESVSMGHPDKVSDAVSDAVLDSLLAVDPQARVACETLCTTGLVVVAGEVTVHNDKAVAALNNIEDTVRKTVKRIGYTDPRMKFDSESCAVLRTIHGQSDDISMGVTEGEGLHKEQGAGDQGLMFGFACKETEDLMPLAIDLSHKLMEKHVAVRESNKVKFLRPDAKSQVTVEYNKYNKPVRVDTVVISTQHGPEWNGDDKQAELRKEIIKHVIEPCMPKDLFDANDVTIHVNPTGQFEIGGPHGDTGLTGRKIIVDTYGGRGRHGGGAFSGKDPSKVDRSAAYMARYIAKNLVAADLCDVCEVQLSYAIGVPEPTSVCVDTYSSNKIPEDVIGQIVREVFPLTPGGIIKTLDLKKPIFEATAAHGHFGRKPGKNGEFSWEKLDKVAALKEAAAAKA